MLEFTSYSIQNIDDLKDLFTICYTIIDDIYKEIAPSQIINRKNILQSKLSDSEIITISLVGEITTIDSENAWFNFVKRNYKDLFPNIGDRSRFNRTKRNLYTLIKEIQNKFVEISQIANSPVRIVDSMPIPVCKFGRAYFSKCFKDIATYGYCASKKETYFGVKLHALVTTEGFITNFLVTSSNVDDRDALFELSSSLKNIQLIGDKGYIDKDIALAIAKEQSNLLFALKRKNSKTPYPKYFRNFLSKTRRRIETSFSQLASQFNINNVLAKTKLGLMTRITLKILAHNICYFINLLHGNSNSIAQIKHLIFG